MNILSCLIYLYIPNIYISIYHQTLSHSYHSVRPLMYGFGDDINPRQDTVELVEDLMIEYIETIVNMT